MIEIKQVFQTYGTQDILKNVSIKIKEKRITALVGANGAGKTTLLNVAANLIPAKSGQVLVDGKNIRDMENIEIAKKIAVLKQTQHLSMRITIQELVAFGRYPHSKGRLKSQDEVKIREAIHYMDLEDIKEKFIDELSGGQRQRAYIAMILAQDTKYIFLDEPLNNLDIKYSVEMMTILQNLVQELDKTVIIVLHDINFAAAFADEIIAMKDGEIIREGPARSMISEDTLKEVFDHEFHIIDVGQRKVCVYFQPEETYPQNQYGIKQSRDCSI